MKSLLLTTCEAADRIGVPTSTVYDLAAAGTLERRFIGKGTRMFRLTLASVDDYRRARSDSKNTRPR